MNPDIIERLAAADPERATTADAGDRDALLAEILSSARPVAASRRRIRPRVGLAIAAVAACAVLTLAGIRISSDGPSIADRAYAALTASGLYHVVAEKSADAPAAALSGPFKGLDREDRTEAWYDTDAPASHELSYERKHGRLVVSFDAASDRDRTVVRGSDGSVNTVKEGDAESTHDVAAERFDPTGLFRQAYREGHVRDGGDVVIDGRAAHRLLITDPAGADPAAFSGYQFGETRSEMLFDARTLYPIRSATTFTPVIDGKTVTVTFTTRYTTFERLPETAENLAKLKIDG